jgi:O-acetyl-ADP-ribose deacetylase (regulator of RNase III)
MLKAARQRDNLGAHKLAHRERYESERGFGRLEQKRMLQADRARRGTGDTLSSASTGVLLPPFEVQGPSGRHLLEVVVGNITHEAVDAIVNPSNRGLFGTAGVDGAVHAVGGPELTAACRAIGGIQYGEAVFTPGFRLPAQHVIHIATLPWSDGQSGELDSLRQGYVSALMLAGRLRCQSITFPAIGTGIYHFPFDLATTTAIETVTEMLQRHGGPKRVRFILPQRNNAERYRQLLADRLAGGGAHATRSLS